MKTNQKTTFVVKGGGGFLNATGMAVPAPNMAYNDTKPNALLGREVKRNYALQPTKHTKPIAYMFKTLFVLALVLYSNSMLAQNGKFVEELQMNPSGLNQDQQLEFTKITNNKLFFNHHFVRIGDFASSLDSGFTEINLSFLPITSIVFQTEGAEFKDESSYYWYATTINTETKDNYGTFSLTKDKGIFSGNISFDANSFEIHDLGGDIICISELNMAEITESECATTGVEGPTPKIETVDICEEGKTKILVIFNDDALTVNTNIQALSQSAVNNLNTIWSRSEIANEAELVGAVFHNFITTSIPNNDVGALSQDPIIQNLRLQHRADIVVLMIGNPYILSSGRQVFGIARSIPASMSTSYCIVSASTAASDIRTFAHEITHLYGGRHDIACDATVTNAHGLIFSSKACWLCFKKENRTVMGCLGFKERRTIDNISNPDVKFQNIPTGTTGANNAAQVRTMITPIANFFPDVIPMGAMVYWPVFSKCDDKPTAMAAGSCGKLPYTYLWEMSTNGINWSYYDNMASTTLILPQPTPASIQLFVKYRCTVTDAAGVSVTKTRTYNNLCDDRNFGGGEKVVSAVVPEVVYPNPTNNQVSITLAEEFDGVINADILSLGGSVVRSIKDIAHSNRVIVINDLSTIASGSYMLRISDANDHTKLYKLNKN